MRGEHLPLRLQLTNGQPFNLDSTEVWTNVTGVFYLFRSSSGGEQMLNAIGTTTFGAGFQNVTYVDVVSATDPTSQLGLENIRVTVVPEPGAAWVGVLGVVLPRRSRNRSPAKW